MEVSKITLEEETKRKLLNPYLSRNKKLQLRIEAMKSYIRSKPAGTPIGTQELVHVGHYKSYGSGWSQIQKLKKKGVLKEDKIPGKMKSIWSIPGDVKTERISELPVEVPSKPEDEVVVSEDKKDLSSLGRALKQVTEVRGTVNEYVIKQAKEFAWSKNSDSLREFIEWLK